MLIIKIFIGALALFVGFLLIPAVFNISTNITVGTVGEGTLMQPLMDLWWIIVLFFIVGIVGWWIYK